MKSRMLPKLVVAFVLILALVVNCFSQAWPISWIVIDWDRNENGSGDDWRDVEYAYYEYDDDYVYLRMSCYALPGSGWPHSLARYKWFIDLDGNLYFSGGNVYDAEYLLFVEDTNQDGNGELFLVSDSNNDGNFGEFEPWPPINYNDYKIVNPSIGGWRINPVNSIEMYIDWSSIGNPSSYWLFWATDQQNPNLDQGPTTDHVDEEQKIGVHNVAATDQTATPSTVSPGETVSIQVTVENTGTIEETFNTTCYFNTTEISTQTTFSLAAAHQANLLFSWNTTGVPPGNYSIRAWADSGSAISESDENDNWCVSLAVVTILLPEAHDVAAISQVPDKTGVINGTSVSINVTVLNLGDLSETFDVACFYDNNLIGVQIIIDLAADASASLIFEWNTTGVAQNTYYIRAMADFSRAIVESNEENNNCTSLQTVTVYSENDVGALFVDKSLTAVVSGQNPPVVGHTTVYELTVVVSNIGGSSVTGTLVNDTVSPDITFVSVNTPSKGAVIIMPPPKLVWSVGSLNPGESATLVFHVSATPSSMSLMYLNHKEDLVASGVDSLFGGQVTDICKTDVTVAPIYRDVAATSQVPSSAIVCQGDATTIYVTVENLGNVSETFDITAYCNNTSIGVLRVYDLGIGIQTMLSFEWDTSTAATGTYSVTAMADSGDEIAESNESNNVCIVPAAITVVIHDIALLSQDPYPSVVVQGEIVTIAINMTNEGTEPETFSITCYYNETYLGQQNVVNLMPSENRVLDFLWNTTEVATGLYYISAHASTVPGEKDTDDNACRSTTIVTVELQQFLVSFAHTGLDSSADGAVLTVNGTSVTYSQLPYNLPVTAGSVIAYSYSDVTSTITGKRFNLTGVTGPNSPMIVAGNVTVTGNYKTQFYLHVTSPHGSPSPTSNWFDSGTSIAASVTSPWSGITGTRYICTGWTGTGSVLATGTAASTAFIITQPSSITWNWKTQYYLTVRTDPSGIAAISGEGWYDETTNVTLLALPVPSYQFTYWDVDSNPQSNGTNPIAVPMNAPHTATAHYNAVQLVVTISPPLTAITLGSTVNITSSVNGGILPYTYEWYSNGTNVGSGATLQYTPPFAGIYYVYLNVTDSVGTAAQSNIAQILVSVPSPVGGYSMATDPRMRTTARAAAYFILVAIFGTALTLMKRKRK